MNKTDYFCRLIRHAANVPVERIQLNEFVPTRETLNSRAPSLDALAENEVRTAVQAYAGLLHVISTIKTHYIVLPTQEPDEAILIGPYRCSEPVYRRVKSILHDRGYWGVQSTDIQAYFSSVAKADESWLLEIVQTESRHLFGTEPHMELIDAQTSNMDARERRVLQGFAERRKEDRQQLVKAVAQGAYTAAGEWLSKLLDWKLDTPMRMQCAACNEMFLSAVLQNPAVEPLEAEELYHIWMCKAESIPGRETLLQMLEEYCALVRRPTVGRSSTLFLDARNYIRSTSTRSFDQRISQMRWVQRRTGLSRCSARKRAARCWPMFASSGFSRPRCCWRRPTGRWKPSGRALAFRKSRRS